MKYFGQSSAFSTQKDTCKSLTPGIFAISLPVAIRCSTSLITPMANRSWFFKEYPADNCLNVSEKFYNMMRQLVADAKRMPT